MVASIHAGIDGFAIAMAARTNMLPMTYVPPPEQFSTEIPLGDPLPEPRKLAVLWPPQAARIDVPAPTDFLPPPNDIIKLRWWPTTVTPRRGSVIIAPPWKLQTLSSFLPVISGLQRLGFDVVG